MMIQIYCDMNFVTILEDYILCIKCTHINIANSLKLVINYSESSFGKLILGIIGNGVCKTYSKCETYCL